MFRHVDQANETDIESLKKQNEKVLSSIQIVENELRHLQTKIHESEEKIDKLIDMNYKIDCLQGKIDKLEASKKESDNIVENLVKKVRSLSESLVGLENGEIQTKTEEKFKCSKCDYETKTKKGLNIHTRRKHTNFETAEYPKSCDLCEKEVTNAKEMRKHIRSHSFTGEFNPYFKDNYKCQDCNFKSQIIETMEVHVGKCGSENFECGLCNFKADYLEILELHLVSCEVYECETCEERTKLLKDMKTHIEIEHGGLKKLYHIKMDRNDPSLVDIKEYRSDKV